MIVGGLTIIVKMGNVPEKHGRKSLAWSSKPGLWHSSDTHWLHIQRLGPHACLIGSADSGQMYFRVLC